ncbi:flagellar basal body L-ring protein FlgH, partial [Escherichia coli]|nr:flagellar basal body L-ring protein FlgH [Escherichia coli]
MFKLIRLVKAITIISIFISVFSFSTSLYTSSANPQFQNLM